MDFRSIIRVGCEALLTARDIISNSYGTHCVSDTLACFLIPNIFFTSPLPGLWKVRTFNVLSLKDWLAAVLKEVIECSYRSLND